MNIFETIQEATRRTEPFHSRFLAAALKESLIGDRSLFDSVWRLATPSWECPTTAEINPEEATGYGRIDICIRTDIPRKQVVGIEVKTAPGSAREGQLERYRNGLEERFPEHDIQIVYLTEFNEKRAGDKASTFSAIKVFKRFAKKHEASQHISWLDIADIPWDGNETWKQHQSYVRNQISRLELLQTGTERERELAYFFGDDVTERFRENLNGLGIVIRESGDIELSEHPRDKSFATSLADAFAVLLDGGAVSRHSNKSDKFPANLRARFLDSAYCEVHKALFDLAASNPSVWIAGERDYGVRTAHSRHDTGVSLVRTRDPHRLRIDVRR